MADSKNNNDNDFIFANQKDLQHQREAVDEVKALTIGIQDVHKLVRILQGNLINEVIKRKNREDGDK